MNGGKNQNFIKTWSEASLKKILFHISMGLLLKIFILVSKFLTLK